MRTALALLVLQSLVVSPAAAQPSSLVGTIVVAHGADSAWNARVIDVAGAARTGGPVEVSFLMGPAAPTSRFQDVVARLEARGVTRIVVVPMLVSSHSGHFEQIRYLVGATAELDEEMAHHLHMSGIERPVTRLPLVLAPALDDSFEMARVLSDRALGLARGMNADPARRALLIVGHGPNSAEEYARWMQHLRTVADSVKRWTGFRDVRVELVRDDAPAAVRAEAVLRVRELITLQQLATGAPVFVVPVLISKGRVSRDKLPADIAGTPSVYDGEPLLVHDALARWIERRVRSSP